MASSNQQPSKLHPMHTRGKRKRYSDTDSAVEEGRVRLSITGPKAIVPETVEAIASTNETWSELLQRLFNITREDQPNVKVCTSKYSVSSGTGRCVENLDEEIGPFIAKYGISKTKYSIRLRFTDPLTPLTWTRRNSCSSGSRHVTRPIRRVRFLCEPPDICERPSRPHSAPPSGFNGGGARAGSQRNGVPDIQSMNHAKHVNMERWKNYRKEVQENVGRIDPEWVEYARADVRQLWEMQNDWGAFSTEFPGAAHVLQNLFL